MRSGRRVGALHRNSESEKQEDCAVAIPAAGRIHLGGRYMTITKRMLLGSAATLTAIASAQAADLPVKAKPVEYVKVCSLYGEGFYYIPGSDICLKVGGYVQADYGWNSAGNGQPHYNAGNTAHRIARRAHIRRDIVRTSTSTAARRPPTAHCAPMLPCISRMPTRARSRSTRRAPSSSGQALLSVTPSRSRTYPARLVRTRSSRCSSNRPSAILARTAPTRSPIPGSSAMA